MTQVFVVELNDIETIDQDMNKKLTEMEEEGYMVVKSHHVTLNNRQAIVFIAKKYVPRERDYGFN